jgi:hypothetical protein
MDFRAQYLQAMRERAPALFKRLSKDGELENQAAAMSEEAELMSRELTKDAPKDKNGLPLRIAGKPRRSSPEALGIVSKQLGSPYISGCSRHWIKSKNPAAPAVKREAERMGAARDGAD